MTRTIEEARRRRRRRQVGRPTTATSLARRERAIALITADPAIKRSQLAEQLDVDPDTARRIRRQLEELDLVPEPPAREVIIEVGIRQRTADRAIAMTGATTAADALELLVAERFELGPPAVLAAGRAAADQVAQAESHAAAAHRRPWPGGRR